jgi:cyclopropane fatty-acyl-phospholipid synthase-like methyltransferase
VLDVGCGAGIPVDRYLVQHGHAVTGIDISRRQIELARRNVPQAQFEVMNMLDLQVGQFRVDGVVSFYAIFHTPRNRHRRLLETFRSFLRRGGVLLITMGAEPWEGTEPDFHGVEMYWSHFGSAQNRPLVEAAGFTVDTDEIAVSGDERHQVILARRI